MAVRSAAIGSTNFIPRLLYRGYGLLVPLATLGTILAVQLIADTIAGDGAFAEYAGTFMPLALSIAATLLWCAGRTLNGRLGRGVCYQREPNAPTGSARHTFLGLPVEYWAPSLLLLALPFGLRVLGAL